MNNINFKFYDKDLDKQAEWNSSLSSQSGQIEYISNFVSPYHMVDNKSSYYIHGP